MSSGTSSRVEDGEARAGDRRLAGRRALEDDNRELVTLRSLVTVYHRLSATALLSADVGAITGLLASHLGLRAFVFSDSLDVIAASAPLGAPLDAATEADDLRRSPPAVRALRAVAETRRSVRSPNPSGPGWLVVAPVVVGNEVAAQLVTVEDPDSATDESTSLLVTEHAATMCGILIGRERAVVAAASRVREDLLEGLLSGRSARDDELDRWAAHLGMDPARPHRVLSIGSRPAAGREVPEGSQHRLLAIVEHFFASRAPGAVIGIRADDVAVVLPEAAGAGDEEPVRLSEECCRYVGQLFAGAQLTVGIGGSSATARSLGRSYREARWCVEAAARVGRPGQVVSFESLGIHRLLLQVADADTLRSFAEEVLGPLVDYERARPGDLLDTLRCFFEEHGSPQRMAQRLHVHPNTVAYRVRRIEEIAGLRLDDHRDRLVADVALEILAVLGGAGDA